MLGTADVLDVRGKQSANVIVDGSGNAKLTDFGIARAARDSDERELVGTARYIAPERVLGKAVTPRTDVYGLGLVRDGLQAAMDAGQIRAQPVTPLAHVVLAAVNEAALYIAGAADPVTARTEMGTVVDGMLARL